MKILFFIPLLFVCYLGIGQTVNSASIIGKPYKIGNLLVAQNDFPNPMNQENAKRNCLALGKGWRLPTKEELNILYQNKNNIGGFVENNYWSSTDDKIFNSKAWRQSFANGAHGFREVDSKAWSMNVRAVKAF